ncbi:MAG TPA: YggS family pyridoxal phosphate enzyme [Acidimicrobiales bacterium]|nr:YggS family pyridoxal phosphate enzyme [Acidimicrobiales bacterium]
MTTPTGFRAEDVADRLAGVRQRIASATSDPSSVTVIAVTKGFGDDAVRAALGAGIVDIGENYADELVAKAAAIDDREAVPRWHFLGSIQRNKVARLAPLVACWQGVSRLEEGRAIAKRRPGAGVLIQVDIAGIPGRGGCEPAGVPGLVSAVRDQGLAVAGLMAVGPPGPPEGSRAGFRAVTALADRLDLPVRSLGMTEDLEVAVAEGSTMVRIGRGLFGDRPARD